MGWGKLVPVIVATVIVAFCAATALLFYLQASPSTQDLDADLVTVRSQIDTAEADAAKYESGLLRATIDGRREVLKTTEAILEQKRSSLLRRVDLRYTVSATPITASQERLDEIAGEIAKAQSKLATDEGQAARYSGGLLQVMALATVATDQLLLAELSLSYYGAKYGFVSPQIHMPSAGTEQKPNEVPGSPVKDKDAF